MKAIAKQTAVYSLTQKNKYTTNEMTIQLIKGDVYNVLFSNDEYAKITYGRVIIYAPLKRLENYFEFIDETKKKGLCARIKESLKKAYNA